VRVDPSRQDRNNPKPRPSLTHSAEMKDTVPAKYYHAIIPTYRAYTCFSGIHRHFSIYTRWASAGAHQGLTENGTPRSARALSAPTRSVDGKITNKTHAVVRSYPRPLRRESVHKRTRLLGCVVVTRRKRGHGLSTVQWEPTQVRRPSVNCRQPNAQAQSTTTTLSRKIYDNPLPFICFACCFCMAGCPL
jgi:hypothetical protein